MAKAISSKGISSKAISSKAIGAKSIIRSATPAVAAGLLLSAAVGSAAAPADDDGCAALAAWVEARVTQSVEQARVGSGAGRRHLRRARIGAPAQGGRHTCGSTASVASRAFVKAVDGSDVRLTWTDDWLRPGDYCLSHDLAQCYPRQHPFAPLPPPSDFARVNHAWAAVARALASQMPYGTSGDLSSFSDASLDAALSSELGVAAAAPAGRTVRRAGAGKGAGKGAGEGADDHMRVRP